MIQLMKIHTKLSPFTTNMELPPHGKLKHIHTYMHAAFLYWFMIVSVVGALVQPGKGGGAARLQPPLFKVKL